MDRKTFLKTGWKYALGKGVELLEDNPIIQSLESIAEDKQETPVDPSCLRQRPPGAAEEDDFLELCTGCDRCMAACPENVIMIENLQTREPVIYPEKGPCVHCEGYPCIGACPTAALDSRFGFQLRLVEPTANVTSATIH